jgi:hypothetical protein
MRSRKCKMASSTHLDLTVMLRIARIPDYRIPD